MSNGEEEAPGPPKWAGAARQDALLAHRRPGYPSVGLLASRARLRFARQGSVAHAECGASRERQAVTGGRCGRRERRPRQDGGKKANSGLQAVWSCRSLRNSSCPLTANGLTSLDSIPIERRVEAAVIAWLRHQTTGYDGMV